MMSTNKLQFQYTSTRCVFFPCLINKFKQILENKIKVGGNGNQLHHQTTREYIKLNLSKFETGIYELSRNLIERVYILK